MSGSTLEVFEDYQKARVKFVQRVAELATRPQKIEELQSAGVMQLLRPLLLDIVCNKSTHSTFAIHKFQVPRACNYDRCMYSQILKNSDIQGICT